MPNGGPRSSGGLAQNRSPHVSSNPNKNVRPRDGGIDNVSGYRSNPKKASGGAFLKYRRMLACTTYVAAIYIR
jgi:hypothetical protein